LVLKSRCPRLLGAAIALGTRARAAVTIDVNETIVYVKP
jgi:hypothetical protein